MFKKGVKTLVLYLEDWQMRMVKDFLGIDCDTYEVSLPGKPETILKYAIPVHEGTKRMYFTDWQMREMRDEAGIVCEFVELHKDHMRFLYMAPHRETKA